MFSLVHERHLNAAHQGRDDVVEHGTQRRQGGEQNDVDDSDDGRVRDDAGQARIVEEVDEATSTDGLEEFFDLAEDVHGVDHEPQDDGGDDERNAQGD